MTGATPAGMTAGRTARNVRLTGYLTGMSRTMERGGLENPGLYDNLRRMLELGKKASEAADPVLT